MLLFQKLAKKIIFYALLDFILDKCGKLREVVVKPEETASNLYWKKRELMLDFERMPIANKI